VGASGNLITDAAGLAFTPAAVTVQVGDTVRWTNKDAIAPHTATEDHALWDLGGSYGQTPVSGAGFPPGASVERTFDAGTYHYYCRVHPAQMHGVVSVPVQLTVRHRRTGRGRHRRTIYTVHVVWAANTPASPLVFDVERARGAATATTWLSGATGTGASFSGGRRGTIWHVRARLRRSDDPSLASGWSPDTVIAAR
jgi:plastocyanin